MCAVHGGGWKGHVLSGVLLPRRAVCDIEQ